MSILNTIFISENKILLKDKEAADALACILKKA